MNRPIANERNVNIDIEVYIRMVALSFKRQEGAIKYAELHTPVELREELIKFFEAKNCKVMTHFRELHEETTFFTIWKDKSIVAVGRA